MRTDERRMLELIADRMEPGHGSVEIRDVEWEGPERLLLTSKDGWVFRVQVECLGAAGDDRGSFDFTLRGERFVVDPGEGPDGWEYGHEERGNLEVATGAAEAVEKEARAWAERWLADYEARGEWSEADGWADEREDASEED